MWNKILRSNVTLWIAVAVLILAVLGGVGTYLILEHWIPYRDAENTMPSDGILSIREQADGTLLLEWPEGENTDSYTLEILRANTVGTEAEDVLYAYTTTDERSCALPELPTDEALTIRIRSTANYRDKSRPGEEALEVTAVLAPPRVTGLTWSADPDTDRVQVHFPLAENETCQLYIAEKNGTPQLLQTLTKGETELAFGKEEAYQVPPFDADYTLSFEVRRELPGLTFYGHICEEVTLCREDFLGTVLELEWEDLGNNAYNLTWNETKGEHYEVQQLVEEEWQTLMAIARDTELSYQTGHLAKFKNFSFRVVAVGSQADTGKPIESEPVSVTTGAAAVYSTIWPIQELEVYADTDRKNVLGKAPAAQAYCVLEEVDGLFGIRFGDDMGYIDSNYCMINLPEYIEDLCIYNITNSYHSIYMVHDYEIPEVTDTVISGYERVELAKNKYLVPFLYPSAQKLVQAAFNAQDKGYLLKIYDSYRPQQATRSIYDLTAAIIGDPIPEYTFAEKKEMQEAGTWVDPTAPEETTPEETPPDSETVPEETESIETYEMLMTDKGRYSLSNFLAKGYSNHNLGVALDLTLVNLYTGEEVEMQTAIHDLSWHSELSLNNDGAKTLQGIMVAAGFGTLKSEWWHFQDNEAKADLKLTALYKGVTPECWMRDDDGWRYRCADGTYYVNCRKIIDGVTYRFDANGYVTED